MLQCCQWGNGLIGTCAGAEEKKPDARLFYCLFPSVKVNFFCCLFSIFLFQRTASDFLPALTAVRSKLADTISTRLQPLALANLHASQMVFSRTFFFQSLI